MATYPSAYNTHNKSLQYNAMYQNGGAGQKAQAQNLAQQSGLNANGTQITKVTSSTPAPSTGDYVSYKTALGSSDVGLGAQSTALNTGNVGLSPQSAGTQVQSTAFTDPVQQMAQATSQVLNNSPKAQVTSAPADPSVLDSGQLSSDTVLPDMSQLTSLTGQSLSTGVLTPEQIQALLLTSSQASAKADPLAGAKQQWASLYKAGNTAKAKAEAQKNGYTFDGSGKLVTVEGIRSYYQDAINQALASGNAARAKTLQNNVKSKYGIDTILPYTAQNINLDNVMPDSYNNLWTPEQIKKYAQAQSNNYYNDILQGEMNEINYYNSLKNALQSENDVRGKADKQSELMYADAILQNALALEKAKGEYGADVSALEKEFAKNSEYLENTALEQRQRALVDAVGRGFGNSTIYDQMALNINRDQMGAVGELATNKQDNIAALDRQLTQLTNEVNLNKASLTKQQQTQAQLMYDELWNAREKERREYEGLIGQSYNEITRGKTKSNSMYNDMYSQMFSENQKAHDQRQEAARQEAARQRQEALERQRMAQQVQMQRDAQAFQDSQRAKSEKHDLNLKGLTEAQKKQEQKKIDDEKKQQLKFQNEMNLNEFERWMGKNASAATKLFAGIGSKDTYKSLINDFQAENGKLSVDEQKYLMAFLGNNTYGNQLKDRYSGKDAASNFMSDIGKGMNFYSSYLTPSKGSSSSNARTTSPYGNYGTYGAYLGGSGNYAGGNR